MISGETVKLFLGDSIIIPVPVSIPDKAILYTSWEAESKYSLGFSVREDAIKMLLEALQDGWLKLHQNRTK